MKFTRGQEFLAEFFGTMVLILFGDGVVAMVVLFANNPPIPGQIVMGGYTNIVLGWGLAVTFGMYIAVTISGAHLNPAVTVALAATKRFPWSKVPLTSWRKWLGRLPEHSSCSSIIVPNGFWWIPVWITRLEFSQLFRRCQGSGQGFLTRSSGQPCWSA